MKHVLAHQVELNAAVQSTEGIRGVVLDLSETPGGVELKVATWSGVVTWRLRSDQTILQKVHPEETNIIGA